MCDFEQTLINAVETELPMATVTCCYLHFCQSPWRRLYELGLSVTYRTHERFWKCIRRFLSIGFLQWPLCDKTSASSDVAHNVSFGGTLSCKTSLGFLTEITSMAISLQKCGMSTSETPTLEQTTMWKVSEFNIPLRATNEQRMLLLYSPGHNIA